MFGPDENEKANDNDKENEDFEERWIELHKLIG